MVQISSEKPIHSPITVVVDFEGLGEEACQVEEDQTPEHRCQVVAACRGEEEEAQASRGEAEQEVLSPSVLEGEVPWGAVQTAGVERRTEAERHQV